MCPSGDVLVINSSSLFAYTAFSVKKNIIIIVILLKYLCFLGTDVLDFSITTWCFLSIFLILAFSIGFILYLIDEKWFALFIFASFHCTKYTFLYPHREQ